MSKKKDVVLVQYAYNPDGLPGSFYTSKDIFVVEKPKTYRVCSGSYFASYQSFFKKENLNKIEKHFGEIVFVCLKDEAKKMFPVFIAEVKKVITGNLASMQTKVGKQSEDLRWCEQILDESEAG